MEKLKSIAKSIWAKIPKTKTEFKDLFDKCLSFLESWLHKIWAFLKSFYVWVSNFYQEHSKLIHKILKSGLSLFLAGLLCLWFYGFIILTFNFHDLYNLADPKPVSWASELRMAALILTAWFGAPFLVWRTMIASAESITAKKQANIAQEKFLDDRFTKAREQLASVIKSGEETVPNIELRIGALYALERTMHDSERDAPAIIDTLATYVRRNCGKPRYFKNEISKEELKKLSEDEIKTKRDEFIETLKEDPPANRYDIQTALKIIGRRPEKNRSENEMPDLAEINLQGAKLVRFDLSLCNLANAHLEGADLQWAKLQEADLHKAKLQDVNLRGANLQRANLQRANLQRTDLYGAKLQVAKLQEADLQWANLQRADLYGAKLQVAKLQDVNLRGANLQRANLQRADLYGAELREANLYGADLRKAELQWAELREANLYGADLRGAKLNEADLQDVQITDAHKTAASVIWVDFTKTKYDLDRLQEQLPDMFGHKKLTKLPKDANGEDMKPPDHWSEAVMYTAEGRKQFNRDWEAFKKEKGVD